MSRIWNRLVRILRQSRVRLPERSLTLQPGDWIQIESSVWRIQSLGEEAGRHRIEMETPDGRAQAALLASETRTGRWTFQQGTLRLELPEDVLVVFPAGEDLNAKAQRRALQISSIRAGDSPRAKTKPSGLGQSHHQE